MTVGKLSCWNSECPSNIDDTCLKDGVADASKCRDWCDSPLNAELRRRLQK